MKTFVHSEGVNLIHLHGTPPPGRLASGLSIPWVTDRRVPIPRSFFRRARPPATVLIDREVPEVAADEWFSVQNHSRSSALKRVGCYVRDDAVRNNAQQVAGRIARFREDVDWILFDAPPSPEEVVTLDLWVDPASSEDDADGMVTEAIACLTPVVAARTALNKRRLDGGNSGLLVPIGDHNELTHAVLNALFKPEIMSPHRQHMERNRDRLRPARRQDAVRRIYAEVAG